MNAGGQLTFSSVSFYSVRRVNLPSASKSLWKYHHGHIQRCVSKVILKTVKLINYHIIHILFSPSVNRGLLLNRFT